MILSRNDDLIPKRLSYPESIISSSVQSVTEMNPIVLLRLRSACSEVSWAGSSRWASGMYVNATTTNGQTQALAKAIRTEVLFRLGFLLKYTEFTSLLEFDHALMDATQACGVLHVRTHVSLVAQTTTIIDNAILSSCHRASTALPNLAAAGSKDEHRARAPLYHVGPARQSVPHICLRCRLG